MYLCNRDLRWAIQCKKLIVEPKPQKIDPTSIDLHLDGIEEAKIWDLEKYLAENQAAGRKRAELNIGTFNYRQFSPKYLRRPPAEGQDNITDETSVFQRGDSVIVRPHGFLLWQTKERIGTPEEDADLICFIDGKSTKSRTGLLVHLTAPTIHASWAGKVTLEISNLGPFDFVLQAGAVIAQVTVARIASIPDESMKKAGSVTFGQAGVDASSSN